MPPLLTPALFVIAIWWIGTGVVLYLQQRLNKPGASLVTALVFTVIASLAILKYSAASISAAHAYISFVAAVGLWGCLELSYYMGLITGIHQRPCPSACSTFTRFKLALSASIWHELSVLLTGIVVLLILRDATNITGLYTFLVLWFMRWSAKLNLFMGVPNFSTDWFPKRLAYVHTYIRRSRVSVLYPVSITAASVVTFILFHQATTLPAPEALGYGLPAALLVLAILEHAFMALPIADTALWNRIFGRDDLPHNESELSSGSYKSVPKSALHSDAVDSNPVSIRLTRVDSATPKIATR